MSSHICLRVHFVWSTLKREPLIHPDWEDRLWAYLGTVLASRQGIMLAVNGTADHIHLYASLPATVCPSDLANTLKANSSRWVHETIHVPRFACQHGYGAFSVSPSSDGEVRGYLQKQKSHHQNHSYQEEYLAFLKRHEVAFDPHYVFE